MTIDIDSASLRLLERNEARAYRVECGGAHNMIYDRVDNQAIDGQLLKFNVAFPYKGDQVMFRPGAFSGSSGRVGFWVDHTEAMEVGSADVMIDNEIVQFRVDLDQCRLAPVIARMVAIDNRSSASVGCDLLEEHREEIDGKSVRVVTRAKLTEITVCAQGAAGDNAFCYLVSKNFTPPPVAGERSATLQAAQALHSVSRKVRALKASMIEPYERRPVAAKRAYTLDDLNRMATEETERLQQRARQMQDAR